jgi:hypothetical protein
MSSFQNSEKQQERGYLGSLGGLKNILRVLFNQFSLCQVSMAIKSSNIEALWPIIHL